MNTDLAFVKRLLVEQNAVGTMQDVGITPEMLMDDGAKVLSMTMTFFKEFGQMPTIETIETMTGVSLAEDAPEPMEFYARRVMDRFRANVLGLGLDSTVKTFRKGDLDQAIKGVTELASKMRGFAGGSDGMIDMTDRKIIDKRIAEYQRVKQLGGNLDGIPTPWKSVNDATGGIHDDELWVLVGRIKTGKTWTGIAMAHCAWKYGVESKKKVLLVSEEMGVWKIGRRWDAIASKLPYNDFRKGMLDSSIEDRWKQELDALAGMPSFLVAGRQRARTVEELEALIEEVDPAITFVDGAYFLDSDISDTSKWERTAGVIDKLQSLVQRKRRPLVVSWQFNRKGAKTGKTDAFSEDIAFAFEVVQNADMVLGVFRDEDLERKKQAIIKVLESRESKRVPPLLIECDLDRMSFDEIGPVPEDSTSMAAPTKAAPVAQQAITY